MAKQFSVEKMAKNSLFETERMFCDPYCFEPGQEQKHHSHRGSDKVYVALEGQGRIAAGPDERDLKEGEAVLVSSGVEHGVFNNSPGRLVLLVFMPPKP
ncbi:MAG: cupin domain-containing protein [Dehalococcoidia bacterium]